MKTTIQWLKEYLETKILPCNEDNEYVYGMNVAHNNLIEYMIPYLLEKEKEQMYETWIKSAVISSDGFPINELFEEDLFDTYYNQTYNQNK